MTTDTASTEKWPSKLCLVGPLPPPAGGMAAQTAQLARLLENEGVSVSLVQVNTPHSGQWWGHIQGLRAFIRLVPYLTKLWRAIGQSQVVHIMANSGWSWHLFAAPAVWIAHIRGVPSVINYRGGGAGHFLTHSNALIKPTLRRTSALIFPSSFLQIVFEKHGYVGHVVPNIVDLSRFSGKREKPAPTVPRLIITRNLETIYGIDTAINALPRILGHYPDATLTIAGSGEERSNLESLTKNLGLEKHVKFLGSLNREQIVELYAQADVLLNPSRVDNMPNSLLESLACGVPIVSTDVGGIPYMVQHEKTALLVRSDDSHGLACETIRILEDTELRERLINNGLQEIRHYGWDSIAELWKSAYKYAISAKR